MRCRYMTLDECNSVASSGEGSNIPPSSEGPEEGEDWSDDDENVSQASSTSARGSRNRAPGLWEKLRKVNTVVCRICEPDRQGLLMISKEK